MHRALRHEAHIKAQEPFSESALALISSERVGEYPVRADFDREHSGASLGLERAGLLKINWPPILVLCFASTFPPESQATDDVLFATHSHSSP